MVHRHLQPPGIANTSLGLQRSVVGIPGPFRGIQMTLPQPGRILSLVKHQIRTKFSEGRLTRVDGFHKQRLSWAMVLTMHGTIIVKTSGRASGLRQRWLTRELRRSNYLQIDSRPYHELLCFFVCSLPDALCLLTSILGRNSLEVSQWLPHQQINVLSMTCAFIYLLDVFNWCSRSSVVSLIA